MKPVAAGKITKAFGNVGEVIAVLYDTFPATYDTGEPLHVYLDGLAVPLFISHFERRGKSGALFVFDDVDSVKRSQILHGLEFFINPAFARRSASGDGLEDFIGYTAVMGEEDSGIPETTGIITSIEGNRANPLFNIESEGNEILVPASEDLISGIDPDKRILYMTLPEGLLEL